MFQISIVFLKIGRFLKSFTNIVSYMKTSKSQRRIHKFAIFFYLCFILSILNTIISNCYIYDMMLMLLTISQRKYPFCGPGRKIISLVRTTSYKDLAAAASESQQRIVGVRRLLSKKNVTSLS